MQELFELVKCLASYRYVSDQMCKNLPFHCMGKGNIERIEFQLICGI